MEETKIQKYCELIEDILDRECEKQRISDDEFNTLNQLLFELASIGVYDINKFMSKKKKLNR